MILSKPRSATNQAFLFFSITTILWSIFNFLTAQFTSPQTVLWLLRLAIFFAVWHTFSVLHLFYVFPSERVKLPKLYKFVLLPIVVLTALLTLTPFVFSEVVRFSSQGQVAQVSNGPGIALFGAVITGLILSALFLLVRKVIRASGIEKIQYQYILIGSLITFSLLIIFNFILPALFDDARFVALGAVFLLPFASFTAYAIIKHQLLDVKVVATEILAFILAIVTLFEVLLSRDLGALLIRVSVFIMVLSFGILLIRSVRKEVTQREELQELTKQLEFANKELKRLDKAKSEFISIASHQLRTPLTAIKGYMSLLREGTYGKLVQKMEKPIANVYASNERLIRLVNDLLSLSRLESGKLEIKWEPTRLEETIQSIVDELNIKAEQKKLKLVFVKPEKALPVFLLDEEKIRNVILNVIDNAIRYTDKGSITVRTRLFPGKLRILISDTGAGMTQDELQKLFQSFTRGSAGSKAWSEGSGLGLYIAKQFVEMHKGKIWAESEGIGKGSTFIIELPSQSSQLDTYDDKSQPPMIGESEATRH